MLEGKVAMVTGGAGGIGRGVARCLAEAGARVAITDIDGDGAREAAEALGVDALGIETDAADAASTTAAIEVIEADIGRLDIVVNNAGVGGPDAPARFREMSSDLSALEGMPESDWDEHLRVNLRTTFATSKAVIPRLSDGGSIVNIASVAALQPTVELPAYGAAKAGVVHLTRTLAAQLAPRGIRANAICPGLLWTRAWEILTARMQETDPSLAAVPQRQIFEGVVARLIPLQREQTPEDIGNLVVFLASDLARNVTGQVIAVDGGIGLGVAALATDADT